MQLRNIGEGAFELEPLMVMAGICIEAILRTIDTRNRLPVPERQVNLLSRSLQPFLSP